MNRTIVTIVALCVTVAFGRVDAAPAGVANPSDPQSINLEEPFVMYDLPETVFEDMYYLITDDGDDIQGYMDLTRTAEDQILLTYKLYSLEMKGAGGSGTIEVRHVYYHGENGQSPWTDEEGEPLLYDSANDEFRTGDYRWGRIKPSER